MPISPHSLSLSGVCSMNKIIENGQTVKFTGRVNKVCGFMVESIGPKAMVGEICYIGDLPAEVVAVEGNKVCLCTYINPTGIQIGCRVVAMGRTLELVMSPSLLGRIIDCIGNPLDGKGPLPSGISKSVFSTPPDILKRRMIDTYIETGIRAIDALLTVGLGQRLGIFSPAGTGKTTLLGMIARNTQADINVIALVGERGREVAEFIKNDLGEEKLKKSVVVVSTSDTSPVARVRGAYTAMAIAEYYRDQGHNVTLFFDSLTRFVKALYEMGLPESELPKLLERCTNSESGTLNGFFTVLSEGESDTVESFLDGHIILTRKLAESNHYPAIDILKSVSRSAVHVAPQPLKKAASSIRNLLAIYRDAEDLINVGAYKKGTNEDIDRAVEKNREINKFLVQGIWEKSSFKESMEKIIRIAGTEK